jgi:hypothetical protein
LDDKRFGNEEANQLAALYRFRANDDFTVGGSGNLGSASYNPLITNLLQFMYVFFAIFCLHCV